MESIAIYWEKQVKVYGIILKHDLTLMGIEFSQTKTFPWHNLLTHTETSPIAFELLASVPCKSNGSILSVILDQEQLCSFQTSLEEKRELQQTSFTLSYKNVEMIYLHGPHFQERFGILARTLEPLYKKGIEPVVTGCAGNSMYIVVDEGLGIQSTEILQNTFQIPSSL
ncbi:hypothetical protein [Desulforhopalus sp. 52FAK]